MSSPTHASRIAHTYRVPRSSGTQRRGGDVEAGGGAGGGGGQKDAELDNLDVDKKGEAGVNTAVNAVLVQVRTLMRGAPN